MAGRFLLLLAPAAVLAQTASFERGAEALTVRWPDERGWEWRAVFSADASKPLIASVGVEGKTVVERA